MRSAEPFRPNQLIAGTNYRYIKVLGEGGQGIVVLAADDFLQTQVVIKFVHATHAAYLSVRIRDEARTLAKLRHQAIVRVIGGGMTAEEQPRGYFVMEFLEGRTLYDMIRGRGSGFPIRTAIDIVIALLEALDVAHSPPHAMIHRDIKPGNIFMARMSSQETQPVLLDFGLAHLFEEASKATGKRFVGTLEYAAPEQLQGKPLSPRTDLYAIGLVLYELIAYRHPFGEACRARERSAIARAHLEDVPRRLSTLGIDIDPALDQLVFSALEKDPKNRPKSAYDFLQKLKAIRVTQDLLHPEPSPQAKTEEEPLETLWARMGISAASTGAGPSSPLWGKSAETISKPRTHTEEEAPRNLPAVSEKLVRAPTVPAPTEELADTRRYAAAQKIFRAAPTESAPIGRPEDISHGPLVTSTAQRLLRQNTTLLGVMCAAIAAALCVIVLYKYTPRLGSDQVGARSPTLAVSSAPSTPIVTIRPPVASVTEVATAASFSATIVAVQPAPVIRAAPHANITALVEGVPRSNDDGLSRTKVRTPAQPSASTSAKPKRPESGLDDPQSSINLLTGP